jgi:hypothetical protein
MCLGEELQGLSTALSSSTQSLSSRMRCCHVCFDVVLIVAMNTGLGSRKLVVCLCAGPYLAARRPPVSATAPHVAPAVAFQTGGKATKAATDPHERQFLLPPPPPPPLLLQLLQLLLCWLGQVNRICWQHWQHCCLTRLHAAGQCHLHAYGLTVHVVLSAY